MKLARTTLHLVSRIAIAAIATAFLAGGAAIADGGSLIGQSAPNFTLNNAVTGASTSLSSLESGKQATVVIFISTKCPVSNAYNERYEALSNSYSDKGVVIVGINSNETEPIDEVASHAQAHGFTFPVLKDLGSAIADAYGAGHTPEVFVIDSHGMVVYHGRIDNSMKASEVTSHDLAKALDQVIAGKPVSPSETKAFGCSIKRPH